MRVHFSAFVVYKYVSSVRVCRGGKINMNVNVAVGLHKPCTKLHQINLAHSKQRKVSCIAQKDTCSGLNFSPLIEY